MEAVVSKSNVSGKKFKVFITNPQTDKHKTVNFGATGYEDYTMHHDDTRKQNYISRHESRENWDDPYTPGFWSRWLLWNKSTLEASAKDISRRYKIRVTIV